jgi:hypothetical protein
MANQLTGALGAQGAAQLGIAQPGTSTTPLSLNSPGAAGASLLGGDQSGQLNAQPYAGYQQGMTPANAPPGTTPDGMISFLLPNPSGRIVYFRIE